jgi:hypothetical protein
MSSAAPTKVLSINKRHRVKGYKKNGGSDEWTNEGQSDDEPLFFFLISLYRYIEVYIIQLTQQYIKQIISEQI